MAEIKDKVVTLESLSALNEHNKETYMIKNSPVGAGSLSINRKADTVVGDCSVAIGYNNEATLWCSYVEGENNISSGNYSHAEGFDTISSGECTHTEGVGTIASSDYQHVQGKYNIEDNADKYAHIVGNGVYDDETDIVTRSNAHTLDWDGNAWFAGDGTFDGAIYANGSGTINIGGLEFNNVAAYIGNNAVINGSIFVDGNSVFNGEVYINNNLILSDNQYGDTLPAAGTKGRIFFKKVTE